MPAPIIPILLAGIGGYFAYGELQKRKLLSGPKTAAPDAITYTPSPAPPVPSSLPPSYAPEPSAAPQPPPIMNLPSLPRMQPNAPPPSAPAPQPTVIATTPAGNPVIVIGPVDSNTGKVTVADQVATSGGAAPAAHDLYDWLKANGNADNDDLTNFTIIFQQAHNADPKGVAVAGRVAESGNYDLPTSGALTVYTGQPIPPTPGVAPTFDTSLPSSPAVAAITGSNLYAYLKTHPRKSTSPTANANADPTLKGMVKDFQHAVNTDPMFPGPANTIPNAKLIKVPLTEDGIYGPKTSDALAVITFERIAV